MAMARGASVEFWDMNATPAPARRSVVAMEDRVYSMVCVGNYTYVKSPVGADWAAMQVIDNTDVAAPRRVAIVPSVPSTLHLVQGMLYASDYTETVIYSLADPSHPVAAGQMGSTRVAATAAAILCTIDFDSLRVYSAWNPAAPVLIGARRRPGYVRDMAMRADASMLYMAGDELYVADISSPDTIPVWIVSGFGWIHSICRAGTTLFGVSSDEIGVFDLLDPAVPTWQLAHRLISSPNFVAPFDTGSVLVATDTGVEWASADAPYGLVRTVYRGRFPTGSIRGMGVVSVPVVARKTAVSRTTGVAVFSANRFGGVRRWVGDVTTLSETVPQFQAAGSADAYNDVAPLGADGTLVAAASPGFVDVFDFATNEPIQVARSDLVGDGESMTAGNGLLFVAQGSTGSISVLDVSVPTAPVLASTIVSSGPRTVTLAYSSQLSLLAAMDDVNEPPALYDVSNPFAPLWAARLDSLGTTDVLWIDGTTLYAAAGDTVKIVNLVPPYAETGRFRTVGWVNAMTTWNPGAVGRAPYAVVVAANRRVSLLDVSDPAAVKEVAAAWMEWPVTDIVVQDNLIFVAVDGIGFEVLRLSMATPVAIASFRARVEAAGVHLRWSVAADEPLAGFEILRSDHTVTRAPMVAVAGLGAGDREYVDKTARAGHRYGYTLVARTAGGMETRSPERVVGVPVPSTRLLGNYPNPFRPSTRVEFELERAGRVEITVYAVSGARVSTITSARYPAGRHEVVWMGRDEAGRRLSSGVYLYRMRAAGRTFSGKLVITR